MRKNGMIGIVNQKHLLVFISSSPSPHLTTTHTFACVGPENDIYLSFAYITLSAAD
jgi:hypothetical protein